MSYKIELYYKTLEYTGTYAQSFADINNAINELDSFSEQNNAVIKVEFINSNWYYELRKDKKGYVQAYYMAKDNNCKSGWFGDIGHFIRHFNKQK